MLSGKTTPNRMTAFESITSKLSEPKEISDLENRHHYLHKKISDIPRLELVEKAYEDMVAIHVYNDVLYMVSVFGKVVGISHSVDEVKFFSGVETSRLKDMWALSNKDGTSYFYCRYAYQEPWSRFITVRPSNIAKQLYPVDFAALFDIGNDSGYVMRIDTCNESEQLEHVLTYSLWYSLVKFRLNSMNKEIDRYLSKKRLR